jgi:hypothetical protein
VKTLGKTCMVRRMNAGISAVTLGASLREAEGRSTGEHSLLGLGLEAVGAALLGRGQACDAERGAVLSSVALLRPGGPTATGMIAAEALSAGPPKGKAVERLRKLAKQDPDASVSAAAAQALQMIDPSVLGAQQRLPADVACGGHS